MKMDKDILVGKVSALLRVWEGIGEIGHGRKVRGWMALITELKKKKKKCKKLIKFLKSTVKQIFLFFIFLRIKITILNYLMFANVYATSFGKH